MERYITLENDDYEILILKDLKDLGQEILDYSTKKLREYLDFFKEESYGKKIKGAYLVNREDFLNRIKKVKSEEDNMPPSWASGCFYGEETQILMDKEHPKYSFNVLVHETFHLLFAKFIYKKNNWNRIIWLDEALACNFDDTTTRIVDNGEFKKLIEKYMNVTTLPTMDNFSFKDGLFITDEWNGYHLFKIIGRYLVETMDKEELFEYINDYKKIKNDGKTILQKSIDYFVEKYNLKK